MIYLAISLIVVIVLLLLIKTIRSVKSMDIIKIHSHSIITIVLMAIALVAGLELYVGLVIVGYWFGREYNQAEMRYMKLKGINRSKLGLLDGFRPSAWNRDSFVNDFLLPTIIVFSLLMGIEAYNANGNKDHVVQQSLVPAMSDADKIKLIQAELDRLKSGTK